MQKGEFNYSSARRYVMSAKRELLRQELSPPLIGYPRKNAETAVTQTETSKDLAKDSDYVGFANLPNQIYRISVRRGFHFTLMVVGESGLGKSTFLNNLFFSNIYSEEYPSPSEKIKPTVQVETTKVLLEENGIRLTLTVVDVPGFGDSLNNTGCWRPIVEFINKRYEQYLEDESRVNRDLRIPDNRVHCCLYFISSCGNGLKPLDVEVMKQLHDKVNIIPVIAKADSFTTEECAAYKRIIMNQIAHHNINVYDFPSYVHGEENEAQRTLKERLPFAIMGSLSIVDVHGNKLRGRKYPWGTAEIENIEHCDFVALRNLFVRTHMQNLKDKTNYQHYEMYRCRKLSGLGMDERRISNKNPMAQMEEERRNHDAKLKRMEQEMEQVFEMKIREKLQKLQDSEAELERRNEQMIAALEFQRRELEERRLNFEREKNLEDSELILGNSDKKKERKKSLF